MTFNDDGTIANYENATGRDQNGNGISAKPDSLQNGEADIGNASNMAEDSGSLWRFASSRNANEAAGNDSEVRGKSKGVSEQVRKLVKDISNFFGNTVGVEIVESEQDVDSILKDDVALNSIHAILTTPN